MPESAGDDLPPVVEVAPKVFEVPILKASDESLGELSGQMGLGLSTEEMVRVRDYFASKGRNPNDIELQALGQAWSEHCCYKSSKAILKETVFDIQAPQNISVISEDAGVVEFDEKHAYVVALESHNHPSALDPYGGAATGIGGILRDVLCMGAQPIALVDPLFFGPLDVRHRDLPAGVKHPRYLLGGVVAGIRDYGNRVGIPTVAGQITFHPGYLTNILVNVGCVGFMPKDELIHSRVGGPGDIYVLAGGRTGRDGIHGVTFASAELTEDSAEADVGAVQLGDPITKEPLMHLSLELNRAGLLTGMKDLGGGGLSCVVGEMALSAGYGARVDLEHVPLKAPDLSPWEIWVSESQERMMFSVLPENLEKVLERCAAWDVEANAIGEVIEEKRVQVDYHGTTIMELDLEFQTEGPLYCRPLQIREVRRDPAGTPPPEPQDYNRVMLDLLAHPNINSKAWAIRMYDHEVRGRTALKPLQGALGHEGPGDAAVMKPLDDSWRGLALTCDVNPRFCELDPYRGGMAAVDETCRNLAAVGARPHTLADCLCFANPEKPERLGDLKAVCQGLYAMAKPLELPFVSGNVSLYNESSYGPIPPTPTLLGCGIVDDLRHSVTSDLKAEDNLLYLIGDTRQELGGSVYYDLTGTACNVVPDSDPARLKEAVDRVVGTIQGGLVRACHDLAEGGLGVALAEMAIGGGKGVQITLSGLSPDLRSDLLLFSESNTRWLMEVEPQRREAFEAIFVDYPCRCLGTVSGSELVISNGEDLLVDLPVEELVEAWSKPLPEVMG